MGIFDIFTGDPAKEAAEKSRAYLTQVGNTGRTDIGEGYDISLEALNKGYGAGRGSLTGGYNTARGDVGSGADAALGAINSGTSGAMGYLDSARSAFTPLSDLAGKYGGGTSLYLDALGVNGAEGNTRATEAFTPSLAYNFNMDQGLEAINRRRNAGGMLASGNADRDAQEYGAGLASREQAAWLDRLGGLINPELQATSGAATGTAGVDVNAANLLRDAGTARAGIESGRGAMLADLAKWYGGQQAGLDVGQGTGIAGLATNAANQRVNLGTSLAQPYTNTFKNEADAEMAGSANAWKLGMDLAKTAASAAGGMPF